MRPLPLDERIDEIRAEFPATSRMGYFNTGTIGPIPKSVLESHQELERDLHLGGPLDRSTNDRVDVLYRSVKAKMASMLGASPDSLALVENTTAGINAALLSHGWEAGDEVLTSDAEHPAVLLPLGYLSQRFGVIVRPIAVRGGVLRADDLSAAIRLRTKAIVVSHVSFSTGGLYPAAEICRLAADRNLLSVIDGAQSAGAVPVDLSELECDYYAFPGYKWLLGPQGTAGLFVSRRARGAFPYRVGSHAVAERFADGGFRLHDDARRFEGTATTSKLDFITLGDAVQFVAGFGWDMVLARVAGLCGLFREGLLAIAGIELISPKASDESSSLICFRLAGKPAADVNEALCRRGLVIRTVGGAGGAGAGGLRASFHFYNTAEEVERLLDAIRTLSA